MCNTDQKPTHVGRQKHTAHPSKTSNQPAQGTDYKGYGIVICSSCHNVVPVRDICSACGQSLKISPRR